MSADDEITEPLKAFLSRYLRGHELQPDEDIFASGYVNSMFAMQLVQFVESQFGINLDEDDLEMDNFRSMSAITAFVSRKRAE